MKQYISKIYPKLIQLSLVPMVILWLLFLGLHVLSINHLHLSLAIQTFEVLLHVILIILVFTIYKSVCLEDKKIIKWFMIANIFFFINDLLFYILTAFSVVYTVDIYGHWYSLVAVSINDISSIIWLVSIIIFFTHILIKYVFVYPKLFIKIIISLITINTVIIGLFLLSADFKLIMLSWHNIFLIASNFIQITIFDFAILSLIYSSNRKFSIIICGLIIIMASEFFVAYSWITHTTFLLSYVSLLWCMGLMCMVYGLLCINYYQMHTLKDWFRSNSSIKSRVTFWSFLISSGSFLIFFIVAYIFSVVNRDAFIGLPLFLMVYSMFVVTLSLFMGKSFEVPFKQIEHNISVLMKNGSSINIDNQFSTEEFVFLQNFIVEAFNTEKKQAKLISDTQEHIKKNVRQMMHDITSPIASISTIVDRLSNSIPEKDRVTLRNASERIASLSQKLLSQYDSKPMIADTTEQLLLSLALLQVVNEKREEHRHTGVIIEVNLEAGSHFAFVSINQGMFKRMLSNLINNAVEALKDKSNGRVLIKLGVNPEEVVLIIHDNGCGMPNDVQEKFKFGMIIKSQKGAGHGIGLTQVRDTIELGNGTYDIYSKTDFGTKLTISFPQIATPDWIATEIIFTKNDMIIILDDDESIHGLWDSNLKPIIEEYPTIKIKHFTYGKDTIDFINSLPVEEKQHIFLLTDYELIGQGINGLDVVEQTKIKRTLLVTSYSAQTNIQEKVLKAGTKLLPKELASAAVIKVDDQIEPYSNQVDMVWVEDQKWFVDDLVQNYYSHLKVDVYYDPIKFMKNVHQYPLNTRIILDTYYNDEKGNLYDIDGLTLAKELHDRGYTKLILYAGEQPQITIPEYLQVVLKLNHKHNGVYGLDKV